MSPRLTEMLTLCREVAVPSMVLAWIVASGAAGIDRSGAASLDDRVAPALMASLDVPPAAQVEVARTASKPVIETPVVTVAALAAIEPEPVVTAALPVASETLLAEPSAEICVSMATPEPSESSLSEGMTSESIVSTSPPQIVDDCGKDDQCVDRYLWALYERTPKQDSIKVHERRKVTVRKKGRQVTVTRTFTKSVNEDFSWKDPNAAEKADKPMVDYVIGGMDRDFKSRLFNLLRAADAAGLSPGITSAFRDNYRQSIASGMKAATDRSYHGGSLRGGYGHGLAADVVSVNGATRAQRMASSQLFWIWIDAHGSEFGIGRPYLAKDPPHIGPIDGKEYADHRPAPKARPTDTAQTPGNKDASRNNGGSSAKTAKSAKVRATRPA